MSSNLTFTFTEEIPKYIELGISYKGPKNPKMAEYNSGEGWKPCPEERGTWGNIIIPIHSNQISFRGDWRDENETYSNMFSNSFMRWKERDNISMSGCFEHNANNRPKGYCRVFYGCDGIISMRDNPLPKITGIPQKDMLYGAFYFMDQITSLPEGFLDLSELRGPPATDMLGMTCFNMEKVSNFHIFRLGSEITFTPQNIIDSLWLTWTYMENWTGTVLWGDKILFEAVTPPWNTKHLYNTTKIYNFDEIHKNWKGDSLLEILT